MAYKYCPECASPLENREFEGKTKRACTACSFVFWNNPLPVVAAVIGIGDGIVLVQRGVEPALGEWALPAGYDETDEDPADGAEREAGEESGLRIKVDRRPTHVLRPPGRNQFILFYRAIAVAGQMQKGSDALAVGVFTEDNMPPLAFATHRQVVAEYFAERRLPFWLRPVRRGIRSVRNYLARLAT